MADERLKTVWVLCDVCGSRDVIGVFRDRDRAKAAEDDYWAEADEEDERGPALEEFVLI